MVYSLGTNVVKSPRAHKIHIIVFRVMKLCWLVGVYQLFEGFHCIYTEYEGAVFLQSFSRQLQGNTSSMGCLSTDYTAVCPTR
jgi:hypothetical protein